MCVCVCYTRERLSLLAWSSCLSDARPVHTSSSSSSSACCCCCVHSVAQKVESYFFLLKKAEKQLQHHKKNSVIQENLSDVFWACEIWALLLLQAPRAGVCRGSKDRCEQQGSAGAQQAAPELNTRSSDPINLTTGCC